MSRGRLLRVLGVGFGLAVIVGNTIGAGILRTPGDVAKQLPHPALFLGVWIAGGLVPSLEGRSVPVALAGSILFLCGAVAADLAGETRDSLYALALLAASYPAYRLARLLGGTGRVAN